MVLRTAWRIHKFFWLPHEEKKLLLRAAAVVSSIRIALWLIPFRSLQSMVSQGARRRPSASIERAAPPAICQAIETVSRFIPAATCLTQALAAQLLLEREGIPGTLHIGVAIAEDNLKAHAWLEAEGKILIGIRGTQHFATLASLRSLGDD